QLDCASSIMSSKYGKKRKSGRDDDTSTEGLAERSRRDERREREEAREDSESPPPTKPKKSKKDDGGDAESMSIEETNKLRASLGLAPLETDDAPKPAVEEDDEPVPEGVNVILEDGIKIHHKTADNWGAKKREREMKEKLEAAKQKRKVHEKVLKAKKIADEVEDDGAASWVEKMRKVEEEKKRAEERAKIMDAMDEEFGVSNLMDEEKEKQKRKKAREAMKQRRAQEDAITAGLIVGHSKESFMGGKDQILVLEDKGVLDDGDEVLVNPNIMDNERHKRNVELKKRKGGKGFDEAYDEYGNAKQSQLLAKYDESLEGVQKTTFRLNDKGEVDLAAEEEEARARARMEMAGKTLVSLDQDKFKVASEFYTQEEMISFRKPKKNKKERTGRKKMGKALKAEDLMPLEEENGGARDMGSRKTRGRHGSDDEDEKMEEEEKEKGIKKEDGELEGEDDGEGGVQKKGWKKATKGAVDIDALRRLAEREEEEEESDDDMMAPDANLAGVVIDDDATDELSSVLDRARRLKQEEARPEANDSEAAARKMLDLMQQHGRGRVKKEDPDGEEEMEVEEYTGPQDGVVCIDSTMEYCRNIGELTSYGITGNRADTDKIDTSKISREEDRRRVKREEGVDDFESVQKWKRAQAEKERRKRERREAGKAGTSRKEDKGGWRADGESRVDSDDERDMMEAAERIKEEDDSEEEEEDGEYRNVLGDEADLQKGVGAMLKLASQKGYLTDPNAKKTSGQSLEHLKNTRATKMENERFDIEDKYVKKLERMGTTGSGPCRSFQEKKDYNPELVIEYVDEKGREMEPKDAFRVMSWKFHGKRPGKKQIEKRANRNDKKELMKKMDSWDTPLGTLNKQLKKQEQMQTPYLVLSNTGKQTELKKD
ncbi:hypothetical protein PENTCL1PPCAC_2732, partial [Pristionchus entomophagus]